MKKIFRILEEIIAYSDQIRERNNGFEVFYRGNNRANFKLLPGLARIETDDLETLENRIYYDFVQYGGHLIPPSKNTWDVLFLMQHHGLPTRLLDWTESLLTALYFAIKGSSSEEDAALWVLDPYGLNIKSLRKNIIDFFDVGYPDGYYDYFVDNDEKLYGTFPKKIFAIGVNPPNPRIVAQRGVFTFHNHKRFTEPLENIYPGLVKKFIIETGLFKEAKDFLLRCGYNEFTLFPDLDGLARHVKDIEI